MGEQFDRDDLSATEGWRNFRRSKLPLHQKLRLTARNQFVKLRTRRPCCGHPGEPGC